MSPRGVAFQGRLHSKRGNGGVLPRRRLCFHWLDAINKETMTRRGTLQAMSIFSSLQESFNEGGNLPGWGNLAGQTFAAFIPSFNQGALSGRLLLDLWRLR